MIIEAASTRPACLSYLICLKLAAGVRGRCYQHCPGYCTARHRASPANLPVEQPSNVESKRITVSVRTDYAQPVSRAPLLARRGRRITAREHDAERRAFARRRFEFEACVEQLAQPLDDRKPYPFATLLAHRARIGNVGGRC